MKTEEMKRRTLNATEMAAYLGIHIDTLYRMCREGQIPHMKFRGRIFFHEDSVVDWMLNQPTMKTEGEWEKVEQLP